MKIWLIIVSIIYLILIAIDLLYYLSISMNGREKLTDSYFSTLQKEPFVSIIVPTFNEENNIKKCLESLRSLNYSNYEIILTDGGSKDKTIEIAYPLADQVIVEEKLPLDWVGKNYGCHLGYEKAQGEILLFTDADTVHTPDSLRIMVSMLLQKKAGLLTAFPYQKLKKWWEAIVPIYFFLSHLTSGGLARVNDPKDLDSYTGSGQYLLFTREAYDKIGGHVRLKGSIIEDYAFARVVKTQLHSLFFTPSNKLVHAHMYPESLSHCWTGFKKVLYAGTKLTPPRRIIIIILYAIAIILSPVLFALGLVYSSSLVLPIIIASVYFAIVLTFAFYWNNKGKHFLLTYLFFPILLLIFIFTLIASTIELMVSKTTVWKGRKYKPDLRAGLNGYHTISDETSSNAQQTVISKTNR